MSVVYNMDCMEGMKKFPDMHFDLAIVDPPFGIGEDWRKSKNHKHYYHTSTYKNDSIPGEDYFKELFRVSKNQIIWGGNYYTEYLPPVNSWIFWDKKRDVTTQFMSEGELAWTSFKVPMRKIELIWNGAVKCETISKIHPHQKPVKLYKWLLHNYASAGNRILDTHLGSGSSRIAAYDMGFEFTAFEIDKGYYVGQETRFQQHIAQLNLFAS
jgi:site-specific DNA-methyltransferase (adenine-specific)